MFNSSRQNLYIGFTKNKKIRLSEFIYLVAFSIYLINVVLYSTMFNVHMNNKIVSISNIFVILIIVVKIFLFDEYTIKQLIAILLLSISIITCYFTSDYKTLLYLALFIIGAKGVSFKKIVKVYFYITAAIVIIAMISVKLGIIEHIISQRDGKPRYAFGSIYCTDFASHIFYLVASYCYIKYEKLSIIHTVIFSLLGIFTYYYNGARLDSACIFIVSVFSLYIIRKKKLRKNTNNNLSINPFFKLLLIFSVPLYAVISIVTTIIYNASNAKMNYLDGLLSARLTLGQIGIIKYGFKLFGQKIIMVGNGGTNEIVTDYFFIDCSYLYIALQYGTIILALLCIYYVFYNQKRIKNGDTLTPIIILFIAINSIVAHHFTDIAYNPFILIFFTSMESDMAIINEKTKTALKSLASSAIGTSEVSRKQLRSQVS